MRADPLNAAAERMRESGQSEAATQQFVYALERVLSGTQTLIPSSELEPAPDVPALSTLPETDAAAALEQLAVIKLNGGLATSMGLQQPKSLLEAREGSSFLEIIVEQTIALRRRHGVRLPLILMNSQATREPTLDAMSRFPELASPGLPADFLQSMVPKLDAETMLPARWPAAPELEWCPPGHGDVYASMIGSGLVDALREQGFRYVMISNSDNLGAIVDPRIAGHIARERIPFLMEVVRGTAADRKGGHIARRLSDGQLVLRETAQTPPEDQDSFRDYRRWRFYNTNSLWLDLEALAERFAAGGRLELPVILNRKTVDPRDSTSTPVLQLEHAMGAAISGFPGASLLEVERTRFVPVKTTDDLLVLRSDAYRIGDDWRVEPAFASGNGQPLVVLDREFFGLIDQFEARMSGGPPSLREALRLVVSGDVSFGAGVVVRGEVEIDAPDGRLHIADGTLLDGADGRR